MLSEAFAYLALLGIGLFLGATVWKAGFARDRDLEVSVSEFKRLVTTQQPGYPYGFIYALFGGALLAFYSVLASLLTLPGSNTCWRLFPAAIMLYATTRMIMAWRKA